MIRIKLKAIQFDTDFRKNEWSNYKEFKKSKRLRGELKANEAILFVSKRRDQLIWILNVGITGIDIGKPKEFIDSRRWRILGGTWDPLMLQNYAEEAGIHLAGIRRFEDLYDSNRKKRLSKKRK